MYLRKMLIQGVRAALPILLRSDGQLGAWLRGLSSPAHSNTMVVALAAKMTRIAWALLRHERYFEMKALPF
jgi:transposase